MLLLLLLLPVIFSHRAETLESMPPFFIYTLIIQIVSCIPSD